MGNYTAEAARQILDRATGDPLSRLRLQLSTAPAIPDSSAFTNVGVVSPPFPVWHSRSGRFMKPSVRKPGRLDQYASRAEHARAHRLAAERNRRDRRRRREGRAAIGQDVTISIRVDMSRFNAAMAGATTALAAMGESVRHFAEQVMPFYSQMGFALTTWQSDLIRALYSGPPGGLLQPRPLRPGERLAILPASQSDITHYDDFIPEDEEDETTGRHSLDCSSSSGGRWSDLMAQIDDLIDEEP